MEDVNSCNINPLSSSKEELKAKIIGLREKKKKKARETLFSVFTCVFLLQFKTCPAILNSTYSYKVIS